MLNRLYVRNYAIIDETEVNYKSGLNIMTGETGAGKSILIGSVNAALGAKTTRDVIRYGADYAVIELSFSELDDRTVSRLKEMDIYPDDGEITLSRKITSSGKSICKINGETVSLADMRECSGYLLDIHGQNEHHSLLKAASHLGIVDKFAGEELEKYAGDLKEAYAEWKKANTDLSEALREQNSADNDTGYLEYAVNEIKAAGLKINEDEELEEEYKVLANSKQIMESLSNAMKHICEDSSMNADDLIGEAAHSMSRAVQYDESLSGLYDILMSAQGLLADFTREVQTYINRADNSAERFAEVSERLDTINTLKKKYGKINGGIDTVLEYLANAESKLERFSDFESYICKLQNVEEKAAKRCMELSDKLTILRRNAAEGLSENITLQLKDLNFAAACFKAEISETETFTANGHDRCEFLISLNPGEPMKPLINVASGGELSRVMLAIKTALADKDEIPSLIFDEIDTGISGRTAQKVSEKLAVLAKTHQIICITHLAQIASMADNHYVIEKTNGADFVKTEIREITGNEKVTELSRILGGAEITEAVLANAREMIKLAADIKKR